METAEHAPKPKRWRGSALLSECGMYRYTLSRDKSWDLLPTKRVVFIGLNPSTADALDDDATIRKLKGFSSRWGYEAFDIVNVFAYRTKSPKILLSAYRQGVDVNGPENDLHIARIISAASIVVAAWGADPIVQKLRPLGMKAHLRAAPCPVVALKLTHAGQPYHPLYVPYDTKPFPFTLE